MLRNALSAGKGPLTRPLFFGLTLLGLTLGAATSFDGGTTHGSAWVVRASICGAALAIVLANPGRILVSWVGIGLMGGWLLIFGIGSLPSVDTPAVLQNGARLFMWIGWAVAATAASAAHRRLGFLILVTIGAFHGGWALLQGFGVLFVEDGRGRGGFFNPNDLAALLAPTIVLLTARLARRGLDGAAFALPLLIGGLLATQSRAGALALLVGLLGFSWDRLGAKRRIPNWAVATACLALGIAALLWAYQRFSGAVDPYAFGRLAIWSSSLQLLADNPTGVGVGNYPWAIRLQGVPIADIVRFPKHAHHPHSEFLWVATEMGWQGLAMSLATLLALGGSLRKLPRGTLGTNLGVLLSFGIPAATGASLHVPIVAAALMAWGGSLVRLASAPAAGTTEQGVNAAGLPLLCFLGLLLTAPLSAAHLCHERALAAPSPALAEAWARRAVRFNPWSVGAQLHLQALILRGGEDPETVVDNLLSIAQRSPHSPLPIQRAAELLEQVAATGSREGAETRQRWGVIAEVRAAQQSRDPKNVLIAASVARAMAAAGRDPGDVLRAAIDLEPNFARGWAYLALHSANDGDAETARLQAAKARASHNMNARRHGYARNVLSLPESLDKMLAEHISPP